jgi:hypothetical protein
VGNYKNDGRKWHRKGESPRVQGHDFPHSDVPRAYPYGIYDLARNRGHVVVGTDHATGQFAVASIQGWWRAEGRRLYPQAQRLLITADGGAAMGIALDCGSWSFSAWLMNFDSLFPSAIFPRAQASGTRSNIVCSLSSAQTGAGNRGTVCQ